MSSLLTETVGDVLVLTLNRPEVKNAFNQDLREQFRDALSKERSETRHRAVLITGAGGTFCAGTDLDPDTILARGPVVEGQMQTGVNMIASLLRDLPVPVVAAVDGAAAGAGFGFALACDFVVVSDRASFHLAFSKIGVSPDTAVIANLVNRIGAARATAVAMLADPISAAEAMDLGLAHKKVAPEDLQETAMALATRLAQGPMVSHAMTKKLVNASYGGPDANYLALEAFCQSRAFTTEDFREGVTAFSEKRKPVFKGK